MLNQATLIGRVGKLETTVTQNGMRITNLTLATSKKFTKDGERKEKTTWHNITLFSKLSEITEKYVNVGDLLYVQGEMDNQKYTDKNGTEKFRNFVVAHDILLFPKAKEHKAKTDADSFHEQTFGSSDIPF